MAIARQSARFHWSRHEDLNKPFAEEVDCSSPARALAVQARLLVGAVIVMAAAFMWLVSNG